MAIAKPTGAKGKADKLFSRIIRKPGACENCDYTCPPQCNAQQGIHKVGCKLQCAHVISRHFSATRCDLRNAFPLCAKCHYHFGAWPLEFSRFVLDRMEESTYTSLKRAAQSGSKIDWDTECERLTAIWTERTDYWDF